VLQGLAGQASEARHVPQSCGQVEQVSLLELSQTPSPQEVKLEEEEMKKPEEAADRELTVEELEAENRALLPKVEV
jgi:hypothetical protein